MDEDLERAKELAWREVAAVDVAHARGELDDDGWHRAMASQIVPAYLGAATLQGGSGHTGSADDWEWSRGVIAGAIERDGSFLDVGCANGLLLDSVARWGRERGLRVEPHGLEIAPQLAQVARRRLPAWADRIHVGNALGWVTPSRFDLVRTGLEYVPAPRRRELLEWLLDEVVAPGGRLIVGKYNEEVERRAVEEQIVRWGFHVAGRAERAHRSEPRLAYRALWLERPLLTDGDLALRALRRDDLPLLEPWLHAPHVDAWWHEPLDADGVRAKYVPRIDGSAPTHVYVVVFGSRPVGWIQWYRWCDYHEHAAQLGAAPDEAGVDLAIGDMDALGRGIGPRALRLLVERVLFADPTIAGCVSDPEAANARSLRAFQKAGFAVVCPVRLPGVGSSRVDLQACKLEYSIVSPK